MARGLNNNNAGNIRLSAVRYLGEKPISTDKAFKQFIAPEYGYRAMFVLLYTYQKKHACQTIRQMIRRWAPPSENDTDSYVRTVATKSLIGADTKITTTNKDVMIPIVSAMSYVENGVPAINADVVKGWELFVKDYKR